MVTLTMPTELKLEHAVLLGIGVLVPASIGAYIILSELAKHPQVVVSIEATEGGTTYPGPNTYTFATTTEVTFEAIAFEGYEFKGWYLDGVFQHANPTINFTASGQNLLIASFQPIGAPPLIPAYIRPVQNCVAEEWWKTSIERETIGLWDYRYLLHLEKDYHKAGFIKFKICDQAGNGVGDQDIAIYSDPMPDITDFGWVIINGSARALASPLILKSDGSGVVSAKVEYQWVEESNYESTIGTGGKVEIIGLTPCGWLYPIYDGYKTSPSFMGITNCSDIKQFQRVKHPIFRTMNPIHAYWVDNPNLLVQGDCYADCMVKIENSKYY